MSDPNKYGLRRYIPSEIRRKIRQRCGFGCVVCGLGIYQYEHIEPGFSEAKEHDPEKMTILCGACHDKVTRKIWSKEKIIKHNKSPKCLELDYSKDFFDIGISIPTVKFGGTVWYDTPTIIQAFGHTILGFTTDEDSGRIEVSGIFHDDNDQEIFRIEKNEWKGKSNYFDIEIEGPRLIIRKELKNIALQIRVKPPDLFLVEQINMRFHGATILGNLNEGFLAQSPDGSTISVAGMNAASCAAGVIIEKTSISMGYKCKEMRFG